VQPKLRPANYEVTECVPNRRFTRLQKFGGSVIAHHRIAPGDGATKVELSFLSKRLLANIVVGNLFSGTIRDYVTTETKSLKNRCDNLAFEEPSQ